MSIRVIDYLFFLFIPFFFKFIYFGKQFFSLLLRVFGVRPLFGEPTNPKSPPGFPILGVTTSQGFEPMTWWVRGVLPSLSLPASLRPLGQLQCFFFS